MGNSSLLIVTFVTICLTLVTCQQQPQQQQQQQQPPPPPAQAVQHPQPNRRNILKQVELLPEYDPLAPSYGQQGAYSKPLLHKPFLPQSSHLLKPGVQYGYAKPELKPELLKPELLLKHELFNKPEFKQLLLAKPDLLKPEFNHLLLGIMQNFLTQKVELLKPQQLPYQPIPLNKYNQSPQFLKPSLLEGELLKFKQPSLYPEVTKESFKPDLTSLLTSIHKPQVLSPSLPPQSGLVPALEAPPLNQVPQLFVPIPAVQQPAQAQPAPPPQTVIPGLEMFAGLPGFGALPGFANLPAFTMPTLPAFDTSCLLHGNCSFGLPPAQLFPQQPVPTLTPLQPTAPLTPIAGGAVVEEQKRANLVVSENELSPEATIGACLATPREPLKCGTQESDWDEVYEQHINCPLATPRVWKCHCGFYKVSPNDPPHTGMKTPSSGHPLPGAIPPPSSVNSGPTAAAPAA